VKILWIARTCPYPPDDGEKLRVWNLLQSVAARHEVTLVYRAMSPRDEQAAETIARLCQQVHAVPVPRPRSNWQRLCWVLPFLFSRYPLSMATVRFPGIVERLRAITVDNTFDLIQVEHSSLAVYLEKLPLRGRPATVLTLHNIDWVRNERLLQTLRWGPARLYQWLNQRRFRAWELAAIARFDEVVVMSEIDAALVRRDLPARTLQVVPNGVAIDRPPLPIDPASRDVVFVASMDSEANHAAAFWLLRAIWPAVLERIPEARLLLVGRDPPAALRAAADGGAVIVTGRVDSVLPWYERAALAVVPLQVGGGTRLKILEAMALGVPVLSTSVGAEGIEARPGVEIEIADGADALAHRMTGLLRDPVRRAALAASARSLVERRYDWKLIGDLQECVYDHAIAAARR